MAGIGFVKKLNEHKVGMDPVMRRGDNLRKSDKPISLVTPSHDGVHYSMFLHNFFKKFLFSLIRIYQLFFSRLLGGYNCRFTPTCSHYMIEAVEKKGLIKGFFLGILRILKCHPFSNKSGYDPVK